MPQKNLRSLSNKINKKLEEINTTNKEEKNLGLGLKIATDLIAGILVSIIIGLFLDKQFKTAPLLLFISLCFGIAASIKNIMIILEKKNES